ncbi:sugar phosphate nucleotidyltransferase [Chloroflexota bacterium]
MKAIILVGGEGTRLRPLTCNTPKTMVPVLDMPFLEYVIRRLKEHRIEVITLAISHLAGPIADYFGDGSRFGVRLNYPREEARLGTAGAVKNAREHLDETFLVLNGDVFTDLDFTAMLNFHREREARVTIALTPVDDPTHYGLIETDARGRVTRFLEKPDWSEVTTNMINAGTYVMEPEILDGIPPQTNFSFENELFPRLLKDGEPVYAYPSTGYWIDIGTPNKYLCLHYDLLGGRAGQHAFDRGDEVIVGERSFIDPSARITGPVLVGSACTIGRKVRLTGPVVIGSGSEIGPGAVIEGAVLWGDVQVGEGAVVKDSVIASNCRIGAGSAVTDGSVLGDNVTVTAGCKLAPASQVWPGKVAGD